MELYEEYMAWILSSKPDYDLPPEKRAVFLIISDLEDRCGLDNAWEEIDYSIRGEIIAEWLEIVETTFN